MDLASDARIIELTSEATAAVNAVHRRPVNLRKPELTSSESALRGARANVDCYLAGVSVEESINAYSVLAPAKVAQTASTFLRAPLQVLALIDVYSGGTGRPEKNPQRLQQLAKLITNNPDQVLAPALIQAELITGGYFGQRSGTVARVSTRIAAIAYGFDPRGLCVPEVYLRRHRAEYETLATHATDDQQALTDFLAFYLQSYILGAHEAEGIAKLA